MKALEDWVVAIHSAFARVYAVPITVLLLAVFISAVPCQARQDGAGGDEGVAGSVVIHAAPEAVFQAIKKSRYKEPQRRHVVSSTGNEVLLEESFISLPFVGDARCLYKEVEVANQRIDYRIVSSNQFKRFNGCWKLSPAEGGKSTLLELTSDVEMHLKVPFGKQLTRAHAKRDVIRRLTDIKESVEGAGAIQTGHCHRRYPARTAAAQQPAL